MSKGIRVYFDTNIFIYAIERPVVVDVTAADSLIRLFTMKEVRSKQILYSSQLSLAELLVIPYRKDDLKLTNRYEGLFSGDLALVPTPVSLDILRIAAMLRSKIPALKLPDAIHVATAIETGCTHFLSADRTLLALIGGNELGLIASELTPQFIDHIELLAASDD